MGPAAMRPVKITKKIRVDAQTYTSSWKPGVAEKEAPSAQLIICGVRRMSVEKTKDNQEKVDEQVHGEFNLF